jgi:hypothetical protein
MSHDEAAMYHSNRRNSYPCCVRLMLVSNNTASMPKPLRYAKWNTTNTTSICETWPK